MFLPSARMYLARVSETNQDNFIYKPTLWPFFIRINAWENNILIISMLTRTFIYVLIKWHNENFHPSGDLYSVDEWPMSIFTTVPHMNLLLIIFHQIFYVVAHESLSICMFITRSRRSTPFRIECGVCERCVCFRWWLFSKTVLQTRPSAISQVAPVKIFSFI